MKAISDWFKLARPQATRKIIQTQIGVHLEEVVEMLLALKNLASDEPTKEIYMNALQSLHTAAEVTKNHLFALDLDGINQDIKLELLDSIIDQAVTGIGICTFMDMDWEGALKEVNRSNYSKFDDEGKPIFLPNGKIAKSPNYIPPNLTPYINKEVKKS